MQSGFSCRVKFVVGNAKRRNHSTQKSLTERIFRKRSKRGNDRSTLVPASFMIRLGPNLVSKYHRNTPDKPKPYGFEIITEY